MNKNCGCKHATRSITSKSPRRERRSSGAIYNYSEIDVSNILQQDYQVENETNYRDQPLTRTGSRNSNTRMIQKEHEIVPLLDNVFKNYQQQMLSSPRRIMLKSHSPIMRSNNNETPVDSMPILENKNNLFKKPVAQR